MHNPLTELFDLIGELTFYAIEKDEKKPVRRWLFVISVVGLVLFWFFIGRSPVFRYDVLEPVIAWLKFFAPVWVTFLLGFLFVEFWMSYVRQDFILKMGGVLLEVKLPREIERTPRAMELFFSAIWEKGSVTYVDTYWDGKLRPWYSFEIASFGGDIHFYVWTLTKYKNAIEAQIYAQYPMVEIAEVPDYATKFRYHPPHNFWWGTYFKLTKPDPYPIMTYVDFGLDRETEEEYKVDPITSILEYLGTLQPGEQVWIQILIRAHAPFSLIEGHLFPRKDWKDEAMNEVNDIMLRHPETKSSRQFTETGFPIIPTLTDGEKKQVEAIERSIAKQPFECAIRGCYMTEPERFSNISVSVTGLLNTFRKPFTSYALNGFKLGWYTDLSDPMKDFLWVLGLREWGIGKFQPKYAKKMLDAYRQRSFFYPPYRFFKRTPHILTAEELATIYHFPGRVAGTPTFGRLPSKKGEPPPNLPV